MSDALDALLARERFAILDGALATELERLGCDLDDPLWSGKALRDTPEVINAVHRRWRDAGSDIISTASYQATIPGFVAAGLDEHQARALLRRSVDLAREVSDSSPAGDPRPLVAASIGSYGAYLADGSEYRGGYGLARAALTEFHRSRSVELHAADLLAFETVPDRVEAEAIAALLSEGPGPRAWVSFSLRPGDSDGNGEAEPRIADGTPLAEAAAPLLDHPRIAAIGVNCVGPREVAPALSTLHALRPSLPLIAYPNSGERWIDRAWSGDGTPPTDFAARARGWVDQGARIIGGCCRTKPEHIAALIELRSSLG